MDKDNDNPAIDNITLLHKIRLIKVQRDIPLETRCVCLNNIIYTRWSSSSLREERIAETSQEISYKGFMNNRIVSFTDTFGKYTRAPALTAVTTCAWRTRWHKELLWDIPLFAQSTRTFRVLTPVEKSLWISSGSRIRVLPIHPYLRSPPFRSAKVRPDYLFKAHRRVHNLILRQLTNQMINIKRLTDWKPEVHSFSHSQRGWGGSV